ncbi:MAG: CDP-alcohol phosphatidyltransferase family protein [Dysgonamonadaceae bacterium]|jgi:hypothetical protein|nr:CDP-alcohol phosphatidyltransferase family protein [Dysgonamonadaceae bacterium]
MSTSTVLESTLKSTDTEDFVDIYFYRPTGYQGALFFRKSGITPNQITLISIFIGIASGICFYFTDLRINVLGIFLLIGVNILNSAHRQLARMTGQKSALGRILDRICGIFRFVPIYIAITCRLWPEWNIWILILTLFSGYCHTSQTALADYYRNIHLLFLKGKNGNKLDNSMILYRNYKKLSWTKKPVLKFFQLIYLNYTEKQEFWTPKMQQMQGILRIQYHEEFPEWFKKQYRKKSLPLIPYTNLLSFNLRSIVLFTCVIINYPCIYFIFEITIMNGMLFYMIRQYERICHKFRIKLEYFSIKNNFENNNE